jgi:hypothetical protein
VRDLGLHVAQVNLSSSINARENGSTLGHGPAGTPARRSASPSPGVSRLTRSST